MERRTALTRTLVSMAFALMAAMNLHAQDAPSIPVPQPVTLRGTAFDSLRNTPLRDATIRIIGRDVTAKTDELGRFQFDNLPAGAYLVIMEHPEIDSLGLQEIAVRTELSASRGSVALAIPSFNTLWRGACGTTAPVADSGFMYGAVRAANVRDANAQSGIPNARVSISWTNTGVSATNKLKQTRLTLETRTDSLGRYLACGLPVDVPLQVAVSVESAGANSASDEPAVITALDLPARTTRVQRRDLTVAIATSGDATPTGTIRGRITNPNGEAFPNARVLTDGVPEARSDSTGAFILRDVPAGTRMIEIVAIGATPMTRTVDVIAGDTTHTSAQMERVITLDRVDVKAKPSVANSILRDFEDRKRMGFGHIQDSTELARVPTMFSAIRRFPGVIPGPKPGDPISFATSMGYPPTCVAIVYIDRVQTEFSHFFSLHPSDIAWIEVYPRRFTVPREFGAGRRVGACGVIAVTTKASIAR